MRAVRIWDRAGGGRKVKAVCLMEIPKPPGGDVRSPTGRISVSAGPLGSAYHRNARGAADVGAAWFLAGTLASFPPPNS
jgi:hypothetical protein